MTQQTITPAVAAPASTACDPATRITKSLLGYGVIAGGVYVASSVTQGLTRSGFSFAHDEWSLLANGGLGWIQIATFLTAGLMTAAAAVGLRRARAGTWAPRLIMAYGVGLVCAGLFRADPAYGFPPGAPTGAVHPSWHGTLHLASAGIGFACLIAACLVLARRFARPGRLFSVATAALFVAGFAAAAAAPGRLAANVLFTAAVIGGWAWLSVLSVKFYRTAGQ